MADQTTEPNQAVTPADIRSLTRQLRSRAEHERDSAARRLHALGPAGTEALLSLVRREACKLWYRNVAISLSGTALCLAAAWYLRDAPGRLDLLFFAVCSLIFIPFILVPLCFVSRAYNDARRALAECRDLRAAGPLLESLDQNWGEPRVRATILEALESVLPQLTPDDASLLSSGPRVALYRLLDKCRSRRDEGLAVLLITTIERVGDSRAVPKLEAIAHSKGKGAYAHRVRDVARASLPFLLARLAESSAINTLLRPAAPDDNESLLRPASVTDQVPIEQLLRPRTADAADTEGP